MNIHLTIVTQVCDHTSYILPLCRFLTDPQIQERTPQYSADWWHILPFHGFVNMLFTMPRICEPTSYHSVALRVPVLPVCRFIRTVLKCRGFLKIDLPLKVCLNHSAFLSTPILSTAQLRPDRVHHSVCLWTPSLPVWGFVHTHHYHPVSWSSNYSSRKVRNQTLAGRWLR